MPKQTGYIFQTPGNEGEYRTLLRKYRLDSLLIRISKEALALYTTLSEHDPPCCKWVNLNVTNQENKQIYSVKFVITPWSLVDLAYEAVKATNDYLGKEIRTDDEMNSLVYASSNVHNERYKELSSSPEWRKCNLHLYLSCLLGEQVIMQRPGGILGSTTRDLYILLELSKTQKNIDDIEVCITTEAGTHWRNVLSSLLLLWVSAVYNMDIKTVEASVCWDKDFSVEDFRAVLNRYTTTYNEIRNSSHTRQSLVLKPYIRTDSKKLLCISCYLIVLLNEHAILWIVRDHYQKHGSSFPSVFGLLFETYFEELLKTYVEDENFVRIPEGKSPRADWRLKLCGLTILVEQKSSLLGLPAKQQEANIETLREYVNRNIVKGLQQLKSTEEQLNLGKCIKIVLLYEGYLKFDLLEFVASGGEFTNDGYFWLVTIDEMEMLLYQYKNNRGLFKTIVEEKIKRHTKNCNDGRSLEQLFQEKGITENQHLLQEKFEFYDNIAENEATRYLKDEHEL